jgi:alanine racemase
MASTERTDDPQGERQVAWFSELRRLYRGIPASLAGASGLLRNRRSYFDLVRGLGAVRDKPDSRFGESNGSCRRAMRPHRACPRHDARAKLHRCRTEAASPRLLVSIGHADGFPRSSNAKTKLCAIIGGYRCPVTAPSSLDLLAIDITDLPDARVGSIGEMATLIASTMTIDEVAEATRSTGREVLSALGSRFHRIYYAT